MDEHVFASFMDEIEKIAKKTYPVSRFITQDESARRPNIEALLGRIRKGGKALAGFEKRKLAEMLKVKVADVEKALQKIKGKAKGQGTFKTSRLLSWSPFPSISPARQLTMRGLVGRHKMKEPHIAAERSVIESLEKHLPLKAKVVRRFK